MVPRGVCGEVNAALSADGSYLAMLGKEGGVQASRDSQRRKPSMAHASVAAHKSAKHDEAQTRQFWPLALGSVGVVFGDIGTSPIYAFREAVAAGSQHGGVSRDVVIAVLSLIIWALILVVTAKYVLLLLRADNRGEGGTLSLMALAHKALGRHSGTKMSGIVF